jgi:hypothetical protein
MKMDSVKFFLDNNYGGYSSKNASNIEMCNLGYFLASDVRSRPSVFKEYAFNDRQQYMSSNATTLEKKDGYILLSDQYPAEGYEAQLKMTRDQFIKLLDDWEEKVIKLEPKEVTITYDNDEFVIETKN